MFQASSVGAAVPAAAQLISVRTVPIYRSHQFDLYPSLTGAMGGIGIAVDDSLLDPFVNPAKGSRVRGARLFASPSLYSVSERSEVGRTLPLGAVVRTPRTSDGPSLPPPAVP